MRTIKELISSLSCIPSCKHNKVKEEISKVIIDINKPHLDNGDLVDVLSIIKHSITHMDNDFFEMNKFISNLLCSGFDSWYNKFVDIEFKSTCTNCGKTFTRNLKERIKEFKK
jgi:hypothetical protein